MRRKLLLATLLLALSQAAGAEARACSCVEYDTPPCAAYWSADAVFTGLVTDIKKPPQAPDAPSVGVVRFMVEDKFRGVSAPEMDVETSVGTMCDLGFKKGERWLVYAYRDGPTGRLMTYMCTRTTRVQHAAEDLAYIRGLLGGKAEQFARGVLKSSGSRLAGVKITVAAGGRTFEATTDAEGAFAVPLPAGGAYNVRATLPFSAAAWTHRAPVREVEATDARTVLEYPVEIPSGGCVYNELEVYTVDLHATAEVAGRVTDESGQTVTRGLVHLVDAAPKEGSEPESRSTNIGPDGAFKFESVAAGSFLLVINPRDEAPGESDAPHPRTFYPSASDRAQASPLVITEGLKLEGINFRVRGPLKKRVITGRVEWPGGRAAGAASVGLYNGDSYVRRVSADADGRFTLDVYGDFDYRIKAEVFGAKRGESEKVKLPPEGEAATILLKLKAG